MNFTYRKQSQFELFPGDQTVVPEMNKSRYPFQEMIISPENMIIVFIVLLMSFVLSFSLGVERGKIIKIAPTAAPKINTVQNKTSAIITPQTQRGTVGVNVVSASTTNSSVSATAIVNSNKLATTQVVPQVPQVVIKPQGNFTIQVASFKLEKSALREANVIKGLGYDAIVLAKGGHFIVCVGRFVGSNDAKKITARLKSRYKDSVVRRL